MGIISRIQVILISTFIVFILIVSFFIVKPLVKGIGSLGYSIFSVYGGKGKKVLTELEQKNEGLLKNKKSIETLSSSENSSAKWYDFLQKLLKDHNIEADRINSTGVQTTGKFGVEDFSFRCKSNYHNIGKFIYEAENSDFVCSVKNVHLISKSLLSNNLSVDITISFYKKLL